MSTRLVMRARGVLDLEPATHRRNAVVVLVVLALASPNIALPGGLPAVRLEQIAALLLLPGIAIYHLRHPAARRLAFSDLAFAAFGASVVVSIVVGPLITRRFDWSVRDGFDVMRVAEYWIVFRLARTLDGEHLATVVRVVLWSAVAIGTLGLVQYLHPPGFNDLVTAIWTTGHNLDGVEESGRIVGTSGNANEFGLLSTLFLILASVHLALRPSAGSSTRLIATAVIVLATFGIVGAQSRTAAVATIIGLAFVIALGWATSRTSVRGGWRRARGATSLVAVSLVAAVLLVNLVPPKSADIAHRFDIFSLVSDPSVVIRLANLRAIFGGGPSTSTGAAPGSPCSVPQSEKGAAPGHAPVGTTGSEPANPEVLARDVVRKHDVARIAAAVAVYVCRHGSWPAGETLAQVLVPEEMDAVPEDPSGQPYRFYPGALGFLVGADLEDASDPSGPVFTMGTIPSMVMGSSFDSGDQVPAGWAVGGGASTTGSGADRLFGSTAERIGLPTTVSWVYQYIVFAFPKGREYTAAIWAHAPPGSEQALELRVVALTNDGRRLDPFAARDVRLPADGRWVRPTVTFQTPADARIVTAEIMLRLPAGAATSVLVVDGASLTEGPFPASYTTVADADPAGIRLPGGPSFLNSPIVGVGPVRDQQLGAVDNEYADLLLHQGVLGLIAFIGVLVAFVLAGFRAWRTAGPSGRVLGLAVAGWGAAISVFDLANGIRFDSQLMVIASIVVGCCVGAHRQSGMAAVSEGPAVVSLGTR